MPLITTTTVTVQRGDELGDPQEATTLVTVATGVPGHITPAAVRLAQVTENALEPINATLQIDPTPAMRQNDVVTDELTGIVYKVQYARPRTGLGLDYQHCGLLSIKELV
jgi:hypothetical protein